MSEKRFNFVLFTFKVFKAWHFKLHVVFHVEIAVATQYWQTPDDNYAFYWPATDQQTTLEILKY